MGKVRRKENKLCRKNTDKRTLLLKKKKKGKKEKNKQIRKSSNIPTKLKAQEK